MNAPPPPEGLPPSSTQPLSHSRARYFRVMGRRRPWLAIAGWGVWMAIALAVGVIMSGYTVLEDALASASPDTPEVQAAIEATRPALPGEPVNVLLIGSDSRGEGDNGRSDSLILMRLDRDRGFISLLSFPRDLYVSVPGFGLQKINAAYGLGGAEKTIETVTALTGQNVNHYINVDFNGFSNLVDEVGGVLIDVDRRYFHSNVGCSGTECYDEIDIEAGYRRLDGAQALDYVRYRHTDGDFARIARQQLFLSELKRQTNQFGNLTRLNSFAEIFAKNTETSIRKVDTLLSIAELALTLPEDRIARTSITGDTAIRAQQSVVLTYPSIVSEKVNEWRDPEFLNVAADEPEPVRGEDAKIIVRNAGTRLLGAAEMAELLREAGFNATDRGNAGRNDLANSIVRYREGAKAAAKRIQARLGPAAGISIAEDGETGNADLLVLVGNDFTGGLLDAPAPAPEAISSGDAAPPPMMNTTSLVDVLRRVEQGTPLATMAPLKLPSRASVRRVTPYRIDDKGKPWAVKLTMSVGYRTYFGMMQTNMKDPPILDGRTGKITRGGREYSTFYDGRNMQRLAWQKDGMTYWISNSLDYALTPDQMWAMAQSARPLKRAKLAAGVTDTAVSIELEGSTP